MELSRLDLIRHYISNLTTAHHCLRESEERDALFQLLATRLHFSSRCEQSSALMESLMQAPPLVACAGSKYSRWVLEDILGCMYRDVAYVKPTSTRLSTEAMTAPDWAAVVAADRKVLSALCNIDQGMLKAACENEEISRRARAILEALDVQACQLPEPPQRIALYLIFAC